MPEREEGFRQCIQFSETIPAYDAITPETGDEPVWKTTSKVWQDGETSPTEGTIVSTTLGSADALRTSTRSVEFGKPSFQTTALQGNRSWKITATAPDGTKHVRQYTAGLLASSTSLRTDNSPLFGYSYTYDTYNRPMSQTDSRTGLTQIRYRSTTAGVVSGVTEPGNRTTSYTHDVRSRRIATTLPDNTISNTTYTPRDEVESQSGSQTYPTNYTYDYAGRMKTLTTSGTAGSVITAWNYSATKGEVVSKRYDSNLTGTTGTGPSYSYTAAGRLNTRTWASGKHTRYDYDFGGRLVHTRYFTAAASDTGANAGNDPATPDISATHDALGRIKDVTRNGALHAQYTYRTSDLKFLSERQQADTLNQTLTYTFEDGQNNTLAGRYNGHNSPAGTTAYSYGATDGRVSSISNPQSSNVSFGYTYIPGSSLVESVTGSAHTVTNTWEPTRDVLATKINATTAGAVSSFRYRVNSIGQREAVSPVLDENDDPVSTYTPAWDWSYNPRGELTEAEDKNGTAHRAYEYDSIGNRTKAIEALAASLAAAPTNYVANALNQYSQIKNPQSTIVNPVHDSDGNLQLDGGINKDSQAREYIWDGENRLIAVKRSDTNATLVTYQYDHHSRLIARSIGGITTRYLYEGWNRIAEYRQTGSGHDLKKSYLWGMDMSGSIQGAGGVGGLLMVSEISNSQISNYHPAYDGNGNITEYLNANGNPVAHYEYDPFGKTTVATGAKANDFTHRFSTKPLDEVTGWYYYGHRFYDPVTGRWPSRDPIEERGGLHLYGFVYNTPLGWIDFLGREGIPSEQYWTKWLEQFGDEDLTERDKEKLKKQYEMGCIGITCINTGSRHKPDLTNCYLAASGKKKDLEDAFEKAKKRRDEMIKDNECGSCEPIPGSTESKPRIFSVRFWSDKKVYKPDFMTGKVKLGNWNPRKGKPNPTPENRRNEMIPFDFGLFEDESGLWTHANHAAPGMKVKTSTLDVYSEPLVNFDVQVFCVTCEDWKY